MLQQVLLPPCYKYLEFPSTEAYSQGNQAQLLHLTTHALSSGVHLCSFPPSLEISLQGFPTDEEAYNFFVGTGMTLDDDEKQPKEETKVSIILLFTWK